MTKTILQVIEIVENDQFNKILFNLGNSTLFYDINYNNPFFAFINEKEKNGIIFSNKEELKEIEDKDDPIIKYINMLQEAPETYIKENPKYTLLKNEFNLIDDNFIEIKGKIYKYQEELIIKENRSDEIFTNIFYLSSLVLSSLSISTSILGINNGIFYSENDHNFNETEKFLNLQLSKKDNELTKDELFEYINLLIEIIFKNYSHLKNIITEAEGEIIYLQPPAYLTIPDTLIKNKAFDPRNRIDEKGYVQFRKETNNPIRIGNLSAGLVIKPSEAIKGNSSPITKVDDYIFNIISSYITSTYNGDIKTYEDIEALEALAPYYILETNLCRTVMDAERPTQEEKDRVFKSVDKMGGTRHWTDTHEYIENYSNRNLERQKRDEIRVKEGRLTKTRPRMIMTSEQYAQHFRRKRDYLLNVTIYEEIIGGNPVRVYRINELPPLLRDALFVQNIKTIPSEKIKTKSITSTDDVIKVKNELIKIIGDANNIIKKSRKEPKLENRHKSIGKLDEFLEKCGVEFNGKTANYRRQQKQRFLKKIEDKLFVDLVNNFEYLENCSFYPKKKGSVKKKILFNYVDKQGNKIE